jgi:LysR family transcriptional regulator, hca operon transcriptional activator
VDILFSLTIQFVNGTRLGQPTPTTVERLSVELAQAFIRAIIHNYLKRSGIKITPAHEADHVTMGISLIMSTRGVGLLPAYAQTFLPASVTSRPLKGESPTVDLVLGYRKSNQSPILKVLLSRLDELVKRVSKRVP